ncbi:glycosyltransferase [Vibrio cyclitrophicus]|uniref:glycosyltransferase n=1 Tax=Vibrio cyclitrophicus TaxID=47951 RepID=UPI00164888A9|nr:glycosyltransferase [Vibrio cyclitrophicus]
MKVAHVFKALNAGGIEKWLTDLSKANRKENRFKLFFYLQTSSIGFFENNNDFSDVLIRRYDLALIGYIRYFFALYQGFRKDKIDVVHAHVHHFSGWILFVAFLAGVKVRVAHCHNDKRNEYKGSGFLKRMYLRISKKLIVLFSNRKIAVSDLAAESLFPSCLDKVIIIPCGISLDFQSNSNNQVSPRNKAKRKVIGHIGSFTKQKNHEFICQLAHDIEKLYPGVFSFQLVGGGPLYEEIREKSNNLGLGDVVEFLGLRDDVPWLMNNIFDIVILPSLHEGLAMVALEAQFYGKFLILSDKLSEQHSLSNYVKYCSIKDTSDFISTLVDFKQPSEDKVNEAKNHIIRSDLNIDNNLLKISDVYKY